MLIVDGFGVEYVKEQHVHHLASVLKEHHKISQDWEGEIFAGINLQWHYAVKHCERTCRLSIKNHFSNLLLKLGQPMPKKPQLYPHK